MFEEIIGEFNPMAAGVGLLGGLISVFVMSGVETSLFLKLASFLLSTVICYFVFSFIMNK